MDSDSIYWPETLPLPSVGAQLNTVPQNEITSMETGRTRIRRRSVPLWEMFDFECNFMEDKFEEFKEFFEQDLENGSRIFVLEVFGVETEVYFAEPTYAWERSDNLFKIKFNLCAVTEEEVDLLLHLDAYRGLYQVHNTDSAATVDGNPVGRWEDQSRRGNHVINPTGGQRGTLKKAALNGRDVVRFDNTDDYLYNTLFTLPQPFTFFVFGKIGVTSPTTSWSSFWDGISSRALFRHQGGSEMLMYAGGAVNAAQTLPVTALWSGVFKGAGSFGLKNGAAFMSGNPGTDGLVGITVGGGSFGPTPLSGDIGELRLYAGEMSVARRQKIELFMTTKWT